MAPTSWTITAAVAMALMSAPIGAQQNDKSSATAAKPTVTAKNAPVQSMITGTVVDQDGVPIPGARVKLRNLKTKEIEQTTSSNRVGFFSFKAQPGIPYTVELADLDGEVVAVSEVITTRTGDVAATTLTAPTRPPSTARLFGETASGVLAAVAGLGITTTAGSDAPPVSPEK